MLAWQWLAGRASVQAAVVVTPRLSIVVFNDRPIPDDEWGEVVAQCEVVGRPIGAIDAFIAATVKVHGLTLVTRDTSDFEPVLTTMLNPWTGVFLTLRLEIVEDFRLWA